MSEQPVDFVQRQLKGPVARRTKPSTIDSVLEADEELLWQVHPRVVPYLGTTPFVLVTFPIALVSAVWLIWLQPVDVRFYLLFVSLCLTLFTGYRALSILWTIRRVTYAASKERLFVCARDPDYLMACAVDVVPMRRVRSVEVERRVADRIFGTGTVVVHYADVEQEPRTATLLALTYPDDVAERLRTASAPWLTDATYRTKN